MTDKDCGKCGVKMVIWCPKDNEDFCEKKKVYTCTQCDYSITEEDSSKCNYGEEE